MRTYRVNEIFMSIQGEGVRAGTSNVFVRLSGCNLACRREAEGFDCDTEFVSGTAMTAGEVVAACREAGGPCGWVVLTGGEPALQLDDELLDALHRAGYRLAVETNGTAALPTSAPIDWVCVSPKTAEHTLKVAWSHELKYVRRKGQAVPRPLGRAEHYLISPAFGPEGLLQEDLDWCLKLVRENPPWRLSVQLHRLLGVR